MAMVPVSSTSDDQSTGTSPDGGGKAACVAGAAVLLGTPADPTTGVTLNVARMPSRIGTSSGLVIWTSSRAVNAWFAGLAAITWYAVVPSSPQPVSMRCDPTNTPSSYGTTSSLAQTLAYPVSRASVAVSVVNGTASKITPGTSNVVTKARKSGAAEIHGSTPAGAVSTSVHEFGTPTVIVPVSSVRVTKSAGTTALRSGLGGSAGGGAAEADCPAVATTAIGAATARASLVAIVISILRCSCARHGGCRGVGEPASRRGDGTRKIGRSR
jgi:hypothetical protein